MAEEAAVAWEVFENMIHTGVQVQWSIKLLSESCTLSRGGWK